MNNRSIIISVFSLFSFLFLFLIFGFSKETYADYQKIAPGDTITLGEFVFDDDFIATTTACTIGITNPLNTEMVASTTMMTANSDGWHYYSYTIAPNAPSGIWPSIMICGSAQRGDLVKVDKSFIVDWSVVSTSTIKEVVDGSLTVATTSLSAVINTHIDSVSNTASSSIVSQILSSIAGIPSAVWSASGRTLSNFGTLVSDVWTNTTRTLTGASLDSGSLSTLSDIQTASSSIASVVNANTNSQTSSITSAVNANTNAQVLNASTSIASAITNSQTSINANTNAATLAASTSLGASINTASSSIVSQITSSILSVPASVWAYSSRTLSTFGTLATDVWGSVTRTLTGASLDLGSLATLSDVTTASSSVVAVVNTNTNSVTSGIVSTINANTDSAILTASTSLATNINANINSAVTNITTDVNLNTNSAVLNASTSLNSSLGSAILTNSGSWVVRMSDTKRIQGGNTYRTKIYLTNAGQPTDAFTVPSLMLYDANRNIVVSSIPMTDVGVGVYEYTYTVASNASQGQWETVISAEVVNGQTVQVNDYWEVAGSPAQVIINGISDNIIPNVSSNVTITNEGLSGYEYQYEWCVVSSINNTCGGGNDIYHATAAKYINPGEDFNTTLSATVPTAGSYYFKLVVYFGTDSSSASRSFDAVSESGTPPPSSGGGGGGGGSMPSVGNTATIIKSNTRTSDFNSDGKVDSIDFSILLAFWKTNPPFKNQKVDINKDGKVDSIDFSILLYQWDKK